MRNVLSNTHNWDDENNTSHEWDISGLKAVNLSVILWITGISVKKAGFQRPDSDAILALLPSSDMHHLSPINHPYGGLHKHA